MHVITGCTWQHNAFVQLTNCYAIKFKLLDLSPVSAGTFTMHTLRLRNLIASRVSSIST